MFTMEERNTKTPIQQMDSCLGKSSKKEIEVYGDFLLNIYDYFVLSFCCPLMWRCSKHKILELQNKHVSNNHLDIGVGTGYFLDKCQFSHNKPSITLLDLSQNCLSRTAKRIERYQPTICLADVYEPLPLGNKRFNSISLNLLLHCLPGTIQDKEKVFENIIPFLSDDGVIFGSTVLGKNVKLNFIARKLMKTYNKHRIFCNLQDDFDGLQKILTHYFSEVVMTMAGSVVLFSAKMKVNNSI